jgi:SAM-dependent methyltransferase
MRNIVGETPMDPLHGRLLFSTRFVSDSDIEDKTILDLGCGFGWFEPNAIRRGCKRIVGIEPTSSDLETARKYVKDARATFTVGNAISIPFECSTFDTVVSWEVLEHIPRDSEDKMFREIQRVLKKGGAFYLSTPNNSFIANVCDPARWLIGHRHYLPRELEYLARETGFKTERIVVKGGFWEIVGINDLYVAKWVFRRRAFFEGRIQRMQDREYQKNGGFTTIFVKHVKGQSNHSDSPVRTRKLHLQS